MPGGENRARRPLESSGSCCRQEFLLGSAGKEESLGYEVAEVTQEGSQKPQCSLRELVGFFCRGQVDNR